MSVPITLTARNMEATHHGIPVMCLGEDDVYAFIALGHGEPRTVLAAFIALDREAYGVLGIVAATGPLAPRIRTRWASVTTCNGDCGQGLDCHHAWTADWTVTEDTPGAAPITVLDVGTVPMTLDLP
ncbi:hypothetical protein [Embleya sp. NPDC001921]